MRASRRKLTIAIGVLAGLALVGGIAVRLGLGETDEAIPRPADAGVEAGGARGQGAGMGGRPGVGGGELAAGMSRIAGTVRDLGRAPVPGIEVRFRGAAGEASATADAGGRYAVELAAGRYRAQVVGDEAVSLDSPWLAVAAGIDQDGVDLDVVRTARVRGRVVDDDGRPVSGARVEHLTRVLDLELTSADTEPFGADTTKAGGEFAVRVPAGEVTLSASTETLRGSTLLRWVEPGADVAGVEILIESTAAPDAGPGMPDPLAGVAVLDAAPSETGTIAGTVRGPAGPLNVFTVEPTGYMPGGGVSSDGALRFVTPDGTYRLEGLRAGRHALIISARGLAVAELIVAVLPGRVADGSVTLGAGAAIDGTITSARTGLAVSGALVSLTTGQAGVFAYSDRAGRFVLHDVAAGRRSLEVHHPAFVGKILTGLELRAGETLRQDVALEPLAEGAAAEIEFAGIGASMQMQSDRCQIVGLVPGGPAEQAGLLPEDGILEIDGRAVAGWTFPQSIEAIRGVAGTVVRLHIVRGADRFYRDVVRATVRFREP